MGKHWTSGHWYIKPGKENEFVAAWRRLAEWSLVALPGAGRPMLLRDSAQPTRFVSFGSWETLALIEDFRSRPEFAAALAEIRPLTERIDVFTLESVVD
jgi:quinol monooxygenase YgiN